MKRFSRDIFFPRALFAALTLFLALIPAAIRVQKLYGESPKVKTSEQVYRNIQVLKGIPATDLYTVMVSFNTALGVTCEYCHVAPTFDKDTKQAKQETRRMILLQTAINREHFNGQERVTCYSCHRGARQVPVYE
jgi:Photosynthetic reaction centre cytochrome C subunit